MVVFLKMHIVLQNHTGKVKGNTVILAGNVAFQVCSKKAYWHSLKPEQVRTCAGSNQQ